MPLATPAPTSVSRARLEALISELLAAIKSGGQGSLSPVPAVRDGLTVCEMCNQFLISKFTAGRSENYVGLLIKELRSFAEGREEHLAGEVTSAEIEEWLHANGWKPYTKRGRLITLKNVFGWAVKRGLLVANPALGVDQPRIISDAPGVHSPATVSHVLETARRVDLNVMRCLAIRYFSGLRTSEAIALEESEIKPKYIEVVARKSKTRQRRLVTIEPALKAFLALGGSLPLKQVHNRLRAVTVASKVEWPHNVCRHTFVTYHLAKYQNAALTAIQAGHTEQIMFNHYREIATPEQANLFWAIRPK
jgi:integrase